MELKLTRRVIGLRSRMSYSGDVYVMSPILTGRASRLARCSSLCATRVLQRCTYSPVNWVVGRNYLCRLLRSAGGVLILRIPWAGI